MLALDFGGGFEVGDGAGDFKDAIVGAGGEAEPATAFSRSFSLSALIVQCLRISFGAICALE
jgi:hypothetical protein